MVIMTMIARLADGLPLAASMQEDEQYGRITVEYQNQAKMLFKKFDSLSPPRCTFKTGEDFFFHCLIENDVIYLALCDKNHSKRLAFSYLEDLAMEFHTLYGKRIHSVNRPYSFIEFDNYIQKAKKVFTDSKARRNLYTLQSGLQDVQNVMVKNIADVLQRGTVLAELDTKAQDLSILSQKYKKDATYLNNKSLYMKAAAGCIAFMVFVLYFWIL